ncbi:hypothetical protein [Kitasatospora sp. NPDC050467]|uniref:hypothetical protein n=1 Tax=unclassified Kitasatospora TaxID=2633591 RepID=UPI0037A1D3DB
MERSAHRSGQPRPIVLVRSGGGIAAPGQLRSLRLAVPLDGIGIDFWRAMALAGLHGALSVAGLTPDDAELVDLPALPAGGQWAAEPAALRDGAVDAVYVKGALDAAPDRRARVNNGTPRPVTVHQRLLDDRPELVARFLARPEARLQAVRPDRTRRGGRGHPGEERRAHQAGVRRRIVRTGTPGVSKDVCGRYNARRPAGHGPGVRGLPGCPVGVRSRGGPRRGGPPRATPPGPAQPAGARPEFSG